MSDRESWWSASEGSARVPPPQLPLAHGAGASVPPPAAGSFCVRCGAPLQGAPFCARCGAQTGAATPTAPHQPISFGAPIPNGGANNSSRAVAIIAIVVVVIAAAVVGIAAVGSHAGGTKHTITGTFTLHDSESFSSLSEGDPCSGSGGYDDIDEGTNVQIEDGKGNLIGTSTLDAGSIIDGACVFDFSVPGVPDADFYRVEVSHRGALSYSKSEMAANDWAVNLTLGSS